MIGAKGLVAEVTVPHTMLAAFPAALGTGDGVGDELAAARTLFETIQTIRSAARIDLVEAWPHQPATFTTRR